MPPWTPSMPWPSGTPGGAAPPAWGGYIRFWLRAGLEAGHPWTLGPHTYDRLDSGNVMGGASFVVAEAAHDVWAREPEEADSRLSPELLAEPTRLWVDLTCDLLDVHMNGGISVQQGIFSKPDAYTLTAHLYDPEGIYDPINAKPPWMFGDQSRLLPGVPIEAFCEVVNALDGTWQRIMLFTGTADSWSEQWQLHPSDRQCELVATDSTKAWANFDRPPVAAAGAGDTTAARIARIATYYGWVGPIDAGTSAVTLQATTFDGQGWELLNRTMDDELGSIYFDRNGHLRWVGRNVWLNPGSPIVFIGCPPPGDPLAASFHDIVSDAQPASLDAQMRNDIYGQRVGGAVVHVTSVQSINRYGRYGYTKDDLKVENDVQVGQWCTDLLQVDAYPRQALESVTLHPAIDPQSWKAWADVLLVKFASDIARISYIPPDDPTHKTDMGARIGGFEFDITYSEWTVLWHLIDAQFFAAANVFTMGPDEADRLDSGFVLK